LLLQKKKQHILPGRCSRLLLCLQRPPCCMTHTPSSCNLIAAQSVSKAAPYRVDAVHCNKAFQILLSHGCTTTSSNEQALDLSLCMLAAAAAHLTRRLWYTASMPSTVFCCT
jgi:hypothetical protein